MTAVLGIGGGGDHVTSLDSMTTDVDAASYESPTDDGVERPGGVAGTEASERQDQVTSLEAANIVLFGKDGTGKSALVVRFLTKRFIHEYDPTSEDVYAHNMEIDGQKVQLRIMDTAGQAERTVHERTEQTRWADGVAIVISLTDRESLREATRIKQFVDDVEGPGESSKPIVLIANKRDLVHVREVTSREVTDLADAWRCHSFETAATEDYTLVEEPFICLYREIKRLRERRGLFPGCQPLEKELIIQDVHKKYRSRLFTR